jgi:adenylate cyclase
MIHTPVMDPTPDQIRSQLDRILQSPGFVGAERVSRFLRYVVERSLAGGADQLKEYVIGVEVFDRSEQYDPRVDSIVRVEAGRLRTKIDEYYHGPGRTDDVIIQLRRGSYAPAFEQRQHDSATDTPAVARQVQAGVNRIGSRWRLGLGVLAAVLVVAAVVLWRAGIWATAERPTPAQTIAVLPFRHYSADAAEQRLAERITDGVTSELARLGTLGVVSHTSALQFAGARKPLREIAQTLGADLILEGNVENANGQLRVQVRLVDATIDQKFWVEDFTGTASGAIELQRRIAQAASAAAAKRRDR